MAELPDYYATLEVAPTCTGEEIKRAYRKAALKWHPDRVPADSPERPKRTKTFQKINDAFYTLSDVVRRKEYDDARSFHGTSSFDDDEDSEEEIPRPPPAAGGNSWANMFGFGKPGAGGTQGEQFADGQFKDAFDEMMGEENNDLTDGTGTPTKKFWAVAGGIAGGLIGFIGGDMVGAIPGSILGYKMGAIRDAKGKSVYQVFQSLDQASRARVLSELAAKILSGAIK